MKVFYTDGACSMNPGPGGWAALSLEGSVIKNVLYDFEDNTTNNRMELTAILNVFKYIDEQNNLEHSFTREQYEIISDSAYAINTITQWMSNWYSLGWVRPKNKPIENLDIIKQLYDYYITKNLKSQVSFTKVHGHCGILGNELCDAICSKNKTKYTNLIHKYNIIDF